MIINYAKIRNFFEKKCKNHVICVYLHLLIGGFIYFTISISIKMHSLWQMFLS